MYSGCGGNGNNFGSREECLSMCHREGIISLFFCSFPLLLILIATFLVATSTPSLPELENVCDSDIDVGECTGVFMRYGYDRHTGDCRQFQYGGCGGNGNNFGALTDCHKKCLNKPTSKPMSIREQSVVLMSLTNHELL
jgi:hypothetical protein